jgi:hypothetical protein
VGTCPKTKPFWEGLATACCAQRNPSTKASTRPYSGGIVFPFTSFQGNLLLDSSRYVLYLESIHTLTQTLSHGYLQIPRKTIRTVYKVRPVGACASTASQAKPQMSAAFYPAIFRKYVGHTCRSHPSSAVRVYDLNVNTVVGWIVEPIVIREARLRSREVRVARIRIMYKWYQKMDGAEKPLVRGNS